MLTRLAMHQTVMHRLLDQNDKSGSHHVWLENLIQRHRSNNRNRIHPDNRMGRGDLSHTRTKRGLGNPRTEWITKLETNFPQSFFQQKTDKQSKSMATIQIHCIKNPTFHKWHMHTDRWEKKKRGCASRFIHKSGRWRSSTNKDQIWSMAVICGDRWQCSWRADARESNPRRLGSWTVLETLRKRNELSRQQW